MGHSVGTPETLKIAIIGAGPAGLSAAHFLMQRGIRATVFEANDRIGGKSFSILNGDNLNEMGTCYTTRSHTMIKGWMKHNGITLKRLGEARFDGEPVVNYVKHGPGAPLPLQVLRFIRKAASLRKAIKARPDDPDVMKEASLSTIEWVRALNIPKIERAMHRIQTTQGYGFVDKATIGQTVQWCDLQYVLSGVLNDLHMPEQGWTTFWQRFASSFDVRLGTPVLGLDRSGPKPVIHTREGEHVFDAVLSTIPMQLFTSIAKATELERRVADSVAWQTYTTTLLASNDWFTGHQVIGYSRASKDSSLQGAILGGRAEGESADLGGRLYVTGQFSESLTPEELREILYADATHLGFTINNVILQKSWQYFPQYKAEAVAHGLFGDLLRVQGHNRTWFSGSTFSHELVSSVVSRSEIVVRDLTLALSGQSQTALADA
ncbi:FAD-dependent oxidoreductase [Hyphomonas chukchiensis]|uniref:Tryptophan 2-monooxygenase n=1 Tax=Hyphomonas chukchiensis TaxID=1280947 RepID=A0A062UCH8_9PROT|nr:FAD-dependent oxidoreductase [Hyphomonas chukchiensis]KCZ53835.1 hypothetical protein HY30_10055 [Hyphomonas chukchiensis]